MKALRQASPRTAAWCFAALVLCFFVSAQAHDVPPSLVLIDIGRDAVDLELQLPLGELGAALSQDLTVAPESAIREHGRQISAYVLDHVRLTAVAGRHFTARVHSLEISKTSNPNWVSNEWLTMRIRMQRPPGADTERFKLDYDVILQPVVTHKALVYVRRDVRNGLLGEAPQPIGLIAFQQTHLEVDGTDGSWWKGFAKLWRLGGSHIAEGTDHLLFLLVLLLPAPVLVSRRRWEGIRSVRDSAWTITKTVSGFTLGHSITLALGALGALNVPAQPVEILIAISIIVSAIHAWRPLFAGRELYLAAGFGLIHGLAFATTLRGLSDDGWTLAVSLVGFNLGIESMQLAVIACVMPWLLILSRTRVYGAVRHVGVTLGVGAALAWIWERVTGESNRIAQVVESVARHPDWIIGILAASALLALALERTVGVAVHNPSSSMQPRS